MYRTRSQLSLRSNDTTTRSQYRSSEDLANRVRCSPVPMRSLAQKPAETKHFQLAEQRKHRTLSNQNGDIARFSSTTSRGSSSSPNNDSAIENTYHSSDASEGTEAKNQEPIYQSVSSRLHLQGGSSPNEHQGDVEHQGCYDNHGHTIEEDDGESCAPPLPPHNHRRVNQDTVHEARVIPHSANGQLRRMNTCV